MTKKKRQAKVHSLVGLSLEDLETIDRAFECLLEQSIFDGVIIHDRAAIYDITDQISKIVTQAKQLDG